MNNDITHTTLLLVRHGETVDNARQIMQGQTQGQLTPHGVEQAQEVALRMAGTHIDAFVSSDLKRAADTCAIIAAPHLGGPERAYNAIVQTPLLRERDWGSFTGRHIPELKYAKWTDDIETTEQMRQRATLFIEMIRRQYPGMTVLAVGHGIINKVIQSVFYNKPMQEIPRMDNAEVRTLVL